VVDVPTTHFSYKAMGHKMLSSGKDGDVPTGSAESPEFTIEQPYINFYIGGSGFPSNNRLELLVDGQVVREQKGESTKGLNVASWDVSDLKGKKAKLRLVDQDSVPWSNISIDNIVFADQPAVPYIEHTLWMDYGTDNYAGVTWSNIPKEDGRTLFIGWANNWLYANDIPTERWRSITTLPRSLTLVKKQGGYRLKSAPIEELHSLRKDETAVTNLAVKKSVDLDKKLEIDSTLMELDLQLDTGKAQTIALTFANDSGHETVFTIDKAAGIYSLDRSKSGIMDFAPAIPKLATAPIAGDLAQVSLHVYVDHSIIEVFVNGGETVFSSQIFPVGPYTQVSLDTDKSVVLKKAVGYDLKSIWPKQ